MFTSISIITLEVLCPLQVAKKCSALFAEENCNLAGLFQAGKHHELITPQPSGLEGYCRHGPGGRPGGRAAAKLAEPISL